MRVILDIGNSAIKAGAFIKGVLNEVRTFLLFDGLLAWLKQIHPLEIATGSVGDEKVINALKHHGYKIIELHIGLHMPFINHYRTNMLGIDRAAAVSSALKLCPGENCLAIDMGSCITYDIVDSRKHYYGGAISPGMRMRFKAMHNFTNKLPMVYENNYDGPIGNNTETCMAAGVVEGIIAEVTHMIERIELQYHPLKVVLTGGDAAFFEKKINKNIFVHPNLVLIGLNEIFELNYPNEL